MTMRRCASGFARSRSRRSGRRRSIPAGSRRTKEAVPEHLLERRANGLIKLFVMRRALEVRARRRDLFDRGEYLPLEVSGTRRDCLFAFARTDGRDSVMTFVPRLVASLVPDA